MDNWLLRILGIGAIAWLIFTESGQNIICSGQEKLATGL